jgi:hypothetical protein
MTRLGDYDGIRVNAVVNQCLCLGTICRLFESL